MKSKIITEVRDIYIITFWITMILFISGILLVALDYFNIINTPF
jgi:hypothetical protein